MAVTIRYLDVLRDLETIVSWLPDLYTVNFPGFVITPEFLARRRHGLREAVRHPGQRVLVADAGRGVVGFAWLALEIDTAGRRRGEVAAIYVAATHRRRGVGRLLMEEAEATFRLWGCRDIHLMVTIGNDAAVHLYEELGYDVTRFQMEKRLM